MTNFNAPNSNQERSKTYNLAAFFGAFRKLDNNLVISAISKEEDFQALMNELNKILPKADPREVESALRQHGEFVFPKDSSNLNPKRAVSTSSSIISRVGKVRKHKP